MKSMKSLMFVLLVSIQATLTSKAQNVTPAPATVTVPRADWDKLKKLEKDKEKKGAQQAAQQKAEKYVDELKNEERFDVIKRLSHVTNSLAQVTNDAALVAQAEINLLAKDLKTARDSENAITKVRFGYVSFSPYTITKTAPNTFQLDKAGDDGAAFVEATLADRYAWRRDNGTKTGWNPTWGLGCSKRNLERREWDWEAKLGFLAKDNSGKDKTSGNTIAAGGNIYGELAVGYPLYFGHQGNGLYASLNLPEIVGTWVSDKEHFDVSGNYKICTALVAGGDVGDQGRQWRMLARIGVGWVETPDISGVGTNGVAIVNSQDGQPDFDTQFGPVTQVLFDLPILEAGTISLSGEFWNVDGISPWRAFISYSRSFSDLKKFLTF